MEEDILKQLRILNTNSERTNQLLEYILQELEKANKKR